ncbi:MAG: hypothetical protein ABI717_08500 [Actinomycetota bacterium]
MIDRAQHARGRFRRISDLEFRRVQDNDRLDAESTTEFLGDRLAHRHDRVGTTGELSLDAIEQRACDPRRVRVELGVELVRVVDEPRVQLLRQQVRSRQRLEVVRVHHVGASDRAAGSPETARP